MSTTIATSGRTLRVGTRRIAVVGPSIRDPRIHLSTVILTVITLGLVWNGFQLSIPQVVLTILACGLLEVVLVYRQSGELRWPASGFQTATSTALVFRVIGTENGDWWSFHGWYLFVAIGVAGLLTKYLVRFRNGNHIFNPSNVGLVAGFILLGSSRVEPLDFWWGPFDWPMLAAYVVIIGGGLFICGRLKLLGMGAAFWVTLALGVAVLAALDQSITTRWSFTPISGAHFWWIVLTSPEILIFLFFMITDPKTVPAGRVARVAFGISVGLVSTVLIAPWQTEFGAKVGLLSGLVVMCAARPLLERWLPAPGSPDDNVGAYARRIIVGDGERVEAKRALTRGLLGALAIGAVATGVAVAGIPNRAVSHDVAPVAVQPPGSPEDIDPATLPTVSIDPKVAGLSATLATQDGAQDLAATLAWNLSIESEAVLAVDASLLPAVDDGARLHDIEDQIAAAGSSGDRVVSTYAFESMHLTVVYPGGLQRGANAGLASAGTVTEVTYDASGRPRSTVTLPFETTFSMRQTTNGSWLTTDTLPYGPTGG